MDIGKFIEMDIAAKYSMQILDKGTLQNIVTLSKIQDILKNTNMRHSIRKSNQRCSDCSGTNVYCGTAQRYFVSNYTESYHICLDCFSASYVETFAGVNREDNECKICGFEW